MLERIQTLSQEPSAQVDHKNNPEHILQQPNGYASSNREVAPFHCALSPPENRAYRYDISHYDEDMHVNAAPSMKQKLTSDGKWEMGNGGLNCTNSCPGLR